MFPDICQLGILSGCCYSADLQTCAAAGIITGDIKLEGHDKEQGPFARISGYVEQVSCLWRISPAWQGMSCVLQEQLARFTAACAAPSCQ